MEIDTAWESEACSPKSSSAADLLSDLGGVLVLISLNLLKIQIATTYCILIMCIISVNPATEPADNLGVSPHFMDEKTIK